MTVAGNNDQLFLHLDKWRWIWTSGDGWEVGVVWEVGSNSFVGSRNYAFVLAIRTVNLKCCDCCAEQKTSKDFS
jgi:hypothetical protein